MLFFFFSFFFAELHVAAPQKPHCGFVFIVAWLVIVVIVVEILLCYTYGYGLTTWDEQAKGS